MALINRWFSTVAAGAGDGTSWVNRAALLDGSGNYSTILTGFAFNTDALLAHVGPGLYVPIQALAAVLFANPPALSRPLFLHGCDSSGVLIEPDQTWLSTEPCFDTSLWPVISPAVGIVPYNLQNVIPRCISFQMPNAGGPALGNQLLADFCVFHCTFGDTAGAYAAACNATRATNCWFECSGDSYATVLSAGGVNNTGSSNCRMQGNSAATGGDRAGIRCASGTPILYYYRCTIAENPGGGFLQLVVPGATQWIEILRSTLANNGKSAVAGPSAALYTTGNWYLQRCQITGQSEYGVFYVKDGHVYTDMCRFRDNILGDLRSNRTPDWGTNVYDDASDADEYVDVAGRDYTIKHTADIWGGHYGAAEASVPMQLLKIHSTRHILWSGEPVLAREAIVWTLRP